LKSGFKERLRLEFEQSSEMISQVHRDFEYQVKEIDGLKSERQKVIDFGLKGFISDVELETRLRRLDAQIKESNIKLKEIDEGIRKLNDGNLLLNKYGNDFVDFTLITTFSQKQKVLNDFLKNIVVTFQNDMNYLIRIQYKLPIDDEVWQTLNRNDASFVSLPTERTKEHKYVLLIPPPLENPTDDSRKKKFDKKVK
jgi:cell fate (sporulation/competence/biofilm development) regulator YmcA (YheA/YmcA/DUF963 family)